MFFRTLLLALLSLSLLHAANQTSTVSPILPPDSLPFEVSIEFENFYLPNGIHSFAFGEYKGRWLLIGGRTNGMHGFNNDDNNFPPLTQNKTVFVIDPIDDVTWTRSLDDPLSGLGYQMIDILSVTSPQDAQVGNTLYIVGGYGVDSLTGTFSTKDTLTAIDVPGLMNWVQHPESSLVASHYIRTIHNPNMQVTGGFLGKGDDDTMLLIFGQNFAGYYYDSSNGDYTLQVRRFVIKDNGNRLQIVMKDPKPAIGNPNYRRRDLNIVDVIEEKDCKLKKAFIAYSGVFTPTTGIWTVPVHITGSGNPSMDDPNNPETFKQGMNNYVTGFCGLYSEKRRDMYSVFLGGISYGFFSNGQFMTDSEFPFINQVTTIKCHKGKYYSQYLMDASYPTILSHQSNPGNVLLFGASSQFFLHPDVPRYCNGVIKFDKLKKGKTLIGYIVGGIKSTLPNTNTMSDSSPSEYVFPVYVMKK